MVEELGFLAGRPGWTVLDAVATYAPEPGGWQAKVFPLRQPGPSSYSRFHISLCDPHGTARFVYQAVSSAEAVRVAESRLRALG